VRGWGVRHTPARR